MRQFLSALFVALALFGSVSVGLGQFSLLSVANINNGGLAAGVAVSGNAVYLANGADGLRIYDVSRPTNPVNICHADGGQFAYGVAVNGHFLYLGEANGFGVYDVSDPTNAFLITNTADASSPIFMVITNGLAYMAAQDKLQIFSVSNPASPVYITARSTGRSTGIAVQGEDIYVADAQLGLTVFDDTVLVNPEQLSISKINNNAEANQVVLSGSYAFLANGVDSLTIYDITNPATPVSIARTNTGAAWSIALSSNYVYLGQSTSVALIDVSNPGKPVKVAQAPTADLTLGVVASGDYIYAATRSSGLTIFQLIPQLGLSVTGTNLSLSWPVTTARFVLEQSPEVTGTNWTALTNVPIIEGQRNRVFLPDLPGSAFFRLQEQ